MEDILVTIGQGRLRGERKTDLRGGQFFSFLGIPYAKPPLGKLRFRDPEPAQSWKGIKEATQESLPNLFLSRNDEDPQPPDSWIGIRHANREESVPCTVMKLNNSRTATREWAEQTSVYASEDCLFVNVFTHHINPNDGDNLRPVMVYVHGGGFSIGSSRLDLFGPEILMTEDIVLVSFNYRVGTLGFLSLEDQGIGNAGLKDSVELLKWVKRNIKQFGGDPNNVTIFGKSAGGATVHYLVLSPLAKGLFHRAISQSGSVLNTSARGKKNNALALAQALGCSSTDPAEVLEFLQELPIKRILEGQFLLGDGLNVSKLRYFSPVVEKKSQTAFLAEDPLKLIFSGDYNHVPFMMGYTSQEGAVMNALIELGVMISLQHFVPFFVGYDIDSEIYNHINKRVSRFYFGSDEPDDTNMVARHKVACDIIILRGINSALKGHAKTSTEPVYFYRVSVECELNHIWKSDADGILTQMSAAKKLMDDLAFLFKHTDYPEIKPGSLEDVTIRRIIKMWTNFARTGNPIPTKTELLNAEWKPVRSADQLNFLDIGVDLVPGVNPDNDRMSFWEYFFRILPDEY